jgi:hypothetical protein
VLDLTFLNQVLHRSRHIFNRYVWITTVLIEEIDYGRLEAFERCIGNLLDVLWPAIAAPPLSGYWIKIVTELRCDHDPVANRCKGVADKFLVGEWAIGLSRVEKRNTTVHGRSNENNHFLSVRRRTVVMHSPKAPFRRDVFPQIQMENECCRADRNVAQMASSAAFRIKQLNADFFDELCRDDVAGCADYGQVFISRYACRLPRGHSTAANERASTEVFGVF